MVGSKAERETWKLAIARGSDVKWLPCRAVKDLQAQQELLPKNLTSKLLVTEFYKCN